MRVFRSNRASRLVDAVCRGDVGRSQGRLRYELHIVQDMRMQGWIELQTAQRTGIWANARVCGYRDFFLEIAQRLGLFSEQEDAASWYRPQQLTWAVAQCLADSELGFRDAINLPDQDDPSFCRALLATASEIATAFDIYGMYRPELAFSWPADSIQGWEARLWSHLQSSLGNPPNTGRLAQQVAHGLAQGSAEGLAAIDRIVVWGVPSVPPLVVQLLAALSEHVQVDLCVLSPVELFVGDYQVTRAVARANPELHSLFARNGKTARELQDVIESHAGAYEEDDTSLFYVPELDRVLRRVQADMLVVRARATEEFEPLATDSSDNSIRVHACTGELREVEVLHELLCDAMTRDPSLVPQDIEVVVSDIAIYRPFFAAFFQLDDADATDETDGRIRLPAACVGSRAANSYRTALVKLLALLDGRARLEDMLDVLALAPVAGKLGVESGDLNRLSEVLEMAGLSWGIDASHRKRKGGVDDELGSWHATLSRLLIGLACSDPLAQSQFRQPVVHGVLAAAGLRGRGGAVLASLSQFVDALRLFDQQFQGRKTPEQWQLLLRNFATGFLVEDAAGQLDALLDAIDGWYLAVPATKGELVLDRSAAITSLKRTFGEGRHAPRLGRVVIRQWDEVDLEDRRIVVLLGANEGVYPRFSPTPNFASQLAASRLGDRSQREEDRGKLLSLLARAQDEVWLFYVGRDAQTGEPMPPSLLISELLEFVARSYPRATHDPWTIVHPLHGNSGAKNRAADIPFTYQAVYRKALEKHEEPTSQHHLQELAIEPESLAVDMRDVVRFFKEPAAAYLAHRLGLRVEREFDKEDAGYDPLDADALALYELRTLIWHDVLLTGPSQHVQDAWSASGRAGVGRVAQREFDNARRQVEVLRGAMSHHYQDVLLPIAQQVEVSCILDEKTSIRCVGRFESIVQELQVFVHWREPRASDVNAAWLYHLLACSAALAEFATCDSVRVRGVEIWSCDKELKLARQSFAPLAREQALEELRRWLLVYRNGLQQPLLWMPESAHDAVTRDESAASARWLGNIRQLGEGDFPSCRQVFGPPQEVVARGGMAQLAANATPLLAPMIEARTTTKYADRRSEAIIERLREPAGDGAPATKKKASSRGKKS